jgi:hypothetical protein
VRQVVFFFLIINVDRKLTDTMKINYVAFIDPTVYSGGGEMIMRQLLQTGRERGHEIVLTSILPKQARGFKDPDLTILTDLFNCPTYSDRFSISKLNDICLNDKYIHFDNAYVDSCNLDYLPCTGEKKGLVAIRVLFT